MQLSRDQARTAGIVVLASLATTAALYIARAFFIPIALSLLFAVLLRPAVRRLEQARMPTPAGALIVALLCLALLTAAGTALAAPAQAWVRHAPETLASARQRLNQLRRPVREIEQAAQRVEGAVSGDSTPGGAGPGSASSTTPGFAARLVGSTTTLVGSAVEVFLLTFLLLASGDLFLQKLLRVLPGVRDRSVALAVTREVEGAVSRYMLATAVINIGQGLVVALAMLLIGLPGAALWGVLTFACEFVPYLGAALMLFLLSVAGLANFPLGHAALPAVSYLLITTLQNNLVSPVAYGRRLRLNPVAVLVGVMFWWFLWGIPGAFLAVPLIATLKIMGDHVGGLSAIGEFLAG